MTIELYTALAGGEVNVKTVHGDVVMKIGPGIQPGDLKKLSNKGIIDSSRGNGSHYVKLNIALPKNIPLEKLDQLKSILSDPLSSTEKSSFGKWCKFKPL